MPGWKMARRHSSPARCCRPPVASRRSERAWSAAARQASGSGSACSGSAGCSSISGRISAALGSDCGPYDRERVTFEHIIPRNPEQDRGWRRIQKSWKQVEPHINRLGNLTFLTREENNLAGTMDWEAKREIYRASSHVLSRAAAEREHWSVSTVTERSEELIAILLREWDLEP